MGKHIMKCVEEGDQVDPRTEILLNENGIIPCI